MCEIKKIKSILDIKIGQEWELFEFSRDFIEMIDVLIIDDSFLEVNIRNFDNYFVFDIISEQKRIHQFDQPEKILDIDYFEKKLIQKLLENDKANLIYLNHKK